MVLLQPRDQLLADLAPQVPRVPGVGGRGHNAQTHRALTRFDDLQTPGSPVPELRGGQDLAGLLSNSSDRRAVVHLDGDLGERAVPDRVQFWNGFSMKWRSGTIRRRRSQMRTTT